MPRWSAGIGTLIALGSIAALWNARGDGDSQEIPGTADTQTADSRVAELERLVAEKDTVIASLAGPGVRNIGLFNREAREPMARMLWARRNDRWTLFDYTHRHPSPRTVVQVWLGNEAVWVPPRKQRTR